MMRHLLALVAFVVTMLSCDNWRCYSLDQHILDQCPQPCAPQLTVDVDPGGPAGAREWMLAEITRINAALGAEWLKRDEKDPQFRYRWFDFADGSKCGNAVACTSGYTNFPDGVWIGWTNLPPQESVTGFLSACEAGYLFVHFLWGSSQDYDPTNISYDHPDCPNGQPAFDWAASLADDLHASGRQVCR